MCFHNSMSVRSMKLAARYGRKSSLIEIVQDIIDEQYHVNAFNFSQYPIVTTSDEIQVFNWGLIPFWIKTKQEAEEIRKMTLNARADTIFEKPSFREPIIKKRCFIPSTGYFEWRHEGVKKIPYYIYLKDEKIFSIITTDTNPLTDYIHNAKHRMPAILSKEDEEKWLDPTLPKKEISSLLKPFEAERVDAFTIKKNHQKMKLYYRGHENASNIP